MSKKTKKIKKGKEKKTKDKKASKKKVRRTPRLKFKKEVIHRTRIRVIGVGGGGSSIVSEIAPQLKRVDFVAANTDLQALRKIGKAVRTFQFGQNLTHGLGCGMDTKVGQKAAREERNKIARFFKGIDLCILVSTLGGGTSSGACPEFAKIAKEMGVMTFGIFTLPFKFEGGKKFQAAKNSLERITPHLNAFCIIPNENIFKIIDKSTPITQAFSSINKKLAQNLRGLIEMIYLPGLINIDFADLKTILEGKGKLSYLNSVISQGQNKSEAATKEVLRSPLNEYGILGAEKIIYNITASQDLGMKEVEHISQTIAEFNKRAKIIFGISQDAAYKDRIRITLLAVGCGKEPRRRQTKLKPLSSDSASVATSANKTASTKKRKPEPQPEQKEGPKPKLRKKKPRKKTKKKAKPKVKPKPKPKAKPKAKAKAKAKPNPSAKKSAKKLVEDKPEPEPRFEKTEPEQKSLTRKSALDLRKEVEEAERDLLEQENQWDIPAFLRKRQEESR